MLSDIVLVYPYETHLRRYFRSLVGIRFETVRLTGIAVMLSFIAGKSKGS